LTIAVKTKALYIKSNKMNLPIGKMI
jgi:hypothetical protein